MRGRTVAGAIGVVTGLAGLAIVLSPGLAADVGVDRFFVFLFGVMAALLAAADVRILSTTEVEQADVPDVEDGVDHPRAGADVDALLEDAAQGYDRYTQHRRDELETRIRAVAIDVLTRQEDCTEDAAEAMLVEGSWTDDPYAAAFLGAIEVDDLPLWERVTNALRPEARFARRATHAIAALAEREEGSS